MNLIVCYRGVYERFKGFKKVLFNYVKDYNELEKKLENLVGNKDVYEELIKILGNCITGDYGDTLSLGICLETLYGNKYNNLLEYIFKSERLLLLNKQDSEEYKELVSKVISTTGDINDDYFNIIYEIKEIASKLSYMKDKMIVSRRVISNLKFNQFVISDDIDVVNKLLRELGYEDKDVSIIVEKLFIGNELKNARKNGNYVSYHEKNKFVDLMNIGGELFDNPFVEDEEKLNNYVKSMVDLLINYNDEIGKFNIAKILPSVGRELKNNNELEYVVINILRELRLNLDKNIDCLKDPEFIMSFELKTDIAIICYDLIEKYNLVRDYLYNFVYSSFASAVNINLDDDYDEEEILNNNSQFLYLCKPSGESYFMSDIKDMNKEYGTRTIEVFNDFKSSVAKKANSKPLASMGGLFEIKDDQIRIIYKRAPGDKYIIYGVIVKKDNRIPISVRKNIVSRSGAISENSEEIEKQIEYYLSSNHRKWTR